MKRPVKRGSKGRPEGVRVDFGRRGFLCCAEGISDAYWRTLSTVMNRDGCLWGTALRLSRGSWTCRGWRSKKFGRLILGCSNSPESKARDEQTGLTFCGLDSTFDNSGDADKAGERATDKDLISQRRVKLLAPLTLTNTIEAGEASSG